MGYITLLLFLIFSANGQASLCSSPATIFCLSPALHFVAIPETEKELDEFCFLLTEHLECLHSYDLVCNGRSEFKGLTPPLDYESLKIFLKDVCEEKDSPHKVLSENLQCIKERIKFSGVTCAREKQKVLEAYRTYLNTHTRRNLYAAGSDEQIQRENCLSDIASVACVIHFILRDCGFKAYELAKHSIARTQILAAVCGLEVFQELTEQIDDFPLQREMKQAILPLLNVESEDLLTDSSFYK